MTSKITSKVTSKINNQVLPTHHREKSEEIICKLAKLQTEVMNEMTNTHIVSPSKRQELIQATYGIVGCVHEVLAKMLTAEVDEKV